MIRHSGLRWRLVASLMATMIVALALVFVLVYEQTGSELRAEAGKDVHGDVSQFAEAVRTMRADSPAQLAGKVTRYVRAQPYSDTTSLLFAVLGGRAITNHPELLGGGDTPDHDETQAEQDEENREGEAIRTGPSGQRTAVVPDLGPARIDEQSITVDGVSVRLGAGESLRDVVRAERTVAQTFLMAGAAGLILVLTAAYVAGALVSRPLRRMARVAAQVSGGDLAPRMPVHARSSPEIRVLAESFNHMLDRLTVAFDTQRAFVADASHELRTPLTVIAGQLEILAAQPHPSPDEIGRTQRLVGGEIARTSRLVDDMLLLTRSEHGSFLHRRRVELRSFVDDLWFTTTAGHDRRRELGPVPEVELVADPDRLAQALRNLIDNALAHTGAHGLVALSIELLPGDGLRFIVGDDGPGIPETERERVFERFHRIDEARDRLSGGAGLGLSIVRAIAEAHGGQVRASARPGGGTRMELDLPSVTVSRLSLRPDDARRARR